MAFGFNYFTCVHLRDVCIICCASFMLSNVQAPYNSLSRIRFHQASFAEKGVASEFHVSQEVAILSISLFVLGLGLGPLLVGPLSEV